MRYTIPRIIKAIARNAIVAAQLTPIKTALLRTRMTRPALISKGRSLLELPLSTLVFGAIVIVGRGGGGKSVGAASAVDVRVGGNV
jgi:hypothetical protein